MESQDSRTVKERINDMVTNEEGHNGPDDAPEAFEEARQALKHAEAELDCAREVETRAEAELSEAEKKLEEAEERIEEIVDLEECAKQGRHPPQAKLYRFKVNETLVSWPKPVITGYEVLEAAGLKPPKDYRLRLKIAGGKPEPIALNQEVDLRRHGIEKFRAIRNGQGEGEDQGRRDAPTLDHDRAFLDGYGLSWEIIIDGSTWVMLYDFPLPPGYSTSTVTLAIRVEGGYPLAQLDMFYMFPRVHRLDGKPIRQAAVIQMIGSREFQRWSRHRTADNPWMAGRDSLETHIYLVEEALAEELAK